MFTVFSCLLFCVILECRGITHCAQYMYLCLLFAILECRGITHYFCIFSVVDQHCYLLVVGLFILLFTMSYILLHHLIGSATHILYLRTLVTKCYIEPYFRTLIMKAKFSKITTYNFSFGRKIVTWQWIKELIPLFSHVTGVLGVNALLLICTLLWKT